MFHFLGLPFCFVVEFGLCVEFRFSFTKFGSFVLPNSGLLVVPNAGCFMLVPSAGLVFFWLLFLGACFVCALLRVLLSLCPVRVLLVYAQCGSWFLLPLFGCFLLTTFFRCFLFVSLFGLCPFAGLAFSLPSAGFVCLCPVRVLLVWPSAGLSICRLLFFFVLNSTMPN